MYYLEHAFRPRRWHLVASHIVAIARRHRRPWLCRPRVHRLLSRSKQHLWQVLPLGSLGYGNSPYSGVSAFAGNELLISLERLAERGWLDAAEVAKLPSKVERVNYDSVRAAKMPLLQQAAEKFLKTAQGTPRDRFESFCTNNDWWL